MSFASFTGTTVSSISSSATGATLHELSHGFGLSHNFLNDTNFHGNLMGNGLRGFRNEIYPDRYPNDETRLASGSALALSVSRYFNADQPTFERVRPTVTVTTTGAVDPVNGLLSVGFTASDAGGLAAALLLVNGEVVGEMPLSGTSASASFLTPTYNPGVDNTVTVRVYDAHGNKQDAAVTVIPTAGLNRAPRASFRLFASQVVAGASVMLNATTTNDPDHATSTLTVEWDLDGDGQFDTAPTTTKTLTTSFAEVGVRLIRLRVTDPAGAQTVSAPIPLRVTSMAPVVGPIADRTIEANNSTGAIPFTLADAESPADVLTIDAFSSDPGLVPDGSIVLSGAGTNRSVTVTPVAGRIGTTTITLAVRDPSGAVATESFVLTVVPGGLRVTTLTPTASGFIADFNRPFEPAVLNLYDAQGAGYGPADVTLRDGGGNPVRGSLVLDATGTRATFLRTGGPLPSGPYTLMLRSAADGFRDTNGNLLNGDNDGLAGGDFVAPLTVAPAAVVVSVPDFTRGPGQALDLPLRLSASAGVASVSLKLRYDPALLTLSGATVPAGVDGSVSLDTTTPGVAAVTFTSPGLPAGVSEFVRLSAAVPEAAASRYTSKQVLDLFDVTVNSAPETDDDGLHVAAYLGDASGNGTLTSLDAALALRIATGMDSGLRGYRLADPVLLADVTGNGRLDSTDATWLLQKAVGLPRPQIPDRPPGVIIPTPPGPDPLLFLPKRFLGLPGDTVMVPVLLDRSEGLESVDLALAYDAARLEFVEARRGSLTGGFDLLLVNPDLTAGTLRIGLSRTAGPMAEEGPGSVVVLTFRVKVHAPAGQAVINLRRSLADTMTQLNEGDLDLNPDPSDEAGDRLDGLITVRGQERSTVRSVVVNEDSPHRLRVTSLTITFSTLVNLVGRPADAFRFLDPRGSARLRAEPSLDALGTATVVRLPFTGRGIMTDTLADGRYTLTIDGEQIVDGLGVAGGDAVEMFFRRYGDSDGDGDMDLLDRAAAPRRRQGRR